MRPDITVTFSINESRTNLKNYRQSLECVLVEGETFKIFPFWQTLRTGLFSKFQRFLCYRVKFNHFSMCEKCPNAGKYGPEKNSRLEYFPRSVKKSEWNSYRRVSESLFIKKSLQHWERWTKLVLGSIW